MTQIESSGRKETGQLANHCNARMMEGLAEGQSFLQRFLSPLKHLWIHGDENASTSMDNGHILWIFHMVWMWFLYLRVVWLDGCWPGPSWSAYSGHLKQKHWTPVLKRGVFLNFHQESWRFVSMRRTQIIRSRDCVFQVRKKRCDKGGYPLVPVYTW